MSNVQTRLSIALAATVLLQSPVLSAQSGITASFDLIPDSGGKYHYPLDMSETGSIVGKYTNSSGRPEAFLWHLENKQFIPLGDLPGGGFGSNANSISADGQIIVGMTTTEKGPEAFKWTSASGMQVIAGLSTGSSAYSYANSVSSDGKTIVGAARNQNNNLEAFILDAESGIHMLGNLGGDHSFSDADKISADGTTVVGRSSSPAGLQAFIWTKSMAMVGLGYLPGISQGSSIAHGVSDDGSVIVGESTTPVNTRSVEAFRWTRSDGMQGLGDLPGGDYRSIAYAVSGDGNIIVGTSKSVSDYEAFIWDHENGMRSLKSVLESEGINLDGWRLINAFYISFDGSVISGIAEDANKIFRAWVAVLPDKRNAIPVANAGKDQNATRGNVVTLDGSASNDKDGDYPLTYQWQIVSKPADSAIVLSDPASVSPAFIPDVIGDYTFALTVLDSTGRSSEADTIVVSTVNAAPVANAGKDIAIVLHGTVATLDGSASSDPEGDAISYNWNMISRPTDSTAVLSDIAAKRPVFVADEHGDYIIELTVTDAHGAVSKPDAVTVSFTNLPPTANAGDDQKDVLAGETVVLTGSGEDPNNDHPLAYEWKMVSWPLDNPVLLAGTTEATISFTPDMAGTYVLELITSDGHVKSEPDSVIISVISVETALYNAMASLTDTINNLAPEAFKKPTLKNALLNKLASVLDKVDAKKYKSAAYHLSKDILRKANGCSKQGKPDHRDWIINCDAQIKVQSAIEHVLALLYRLAPAMKIDAHADSGHHKDSGHERREKGSGDGRDRHQKKVSHRREKR